MDFTDFVIAAGSYGVNRGTGRSDPAQYQELPVATLRVVIARRQGLPLFAKLMLDLDTDSHEEKIPYDSHVDMEMFRANILRQTLPPR